MIQTTPFKKLLDEAVIDISYLYDVLNEQDMGKMVEARTQESIDWTVKKYWPFEGEFIEQYRLILKESFESGKPALWFVCQRDVHKLARQVIMDVAGISADKFLKGELQEGDCGRIKEVFNQIEGCQITIVPYFENSDFVSNENFMIAVNASCQIVCDWYVEDKDMPFILEAEERSHLKFLVF